MRPQRSPAQQCGAAHWLAALSGDVPGVMGLGVNTQPSCHSSLGGARGAAQDNAPTAADNASAQDAVERV